MIKFENCFGTELTECKNCGKCEKRKIEIKFDKFISEYCADCIHFETWNEDYGSEFNCNKRFANLVYSEPCSDVNCDCNNCERNLCDCVDCIDFEESKLSHLHEDY